MGWRSSVGNANSPRNHTAYAESIFPYRCLVDSRDTSGSGPCLVFRFPSSPPLFLVPPTFLRDLILVR